MAAPNTLNDPYEGRYTPNWGLLSDPAIQEAYIRQGMKRQREFRQAMGISDAEGLEMVKERLKNLTAFEDDYDSQLISRQNENYGVCSFSSNGDNPLLWSHYSEAHAGFCVALNTPVLLSSDSEVRGFAGPIQYVEDYPDISPLEHFLPDAIFKAHFCKPREWEYEQEFRIVRILLRKGVLEGRLKRLPDSAYHEIILGAKFPHERIPDVLQIAKAKGIPVSQVYLGKRSYELLKEPIFAP